MEHREVKSRKEIAELKKRSPGGYRNLREEVVNKAGFEWSKFRQAISRWEKIMNIPAPSPTKPDEKNGSIRLNSGFTEWMMGLKPGWITGSNLSRTEELRMTGNGVVPQQAKRALQILSERID